VDDLRPLLRGIVDKLDGALTRLDAIDAGVVATRQETQSLARVTTTLGQEFKTFSGWLAILAGAQADMSKALGGLTEQVAALGNRVDRIVEVHVRAQTDEVGRYGALEARVADLERRMGELTPAPAR
jgi:hypothetical protein